MTTFIGSESGFTVFGGGEVLQVDAWGESGVRVRAALGGAVTETPGSALCEADEVDAQIEISDDRARMRNGDLIVEVYVNHEDRFVPFPPLVRFLRTDGEELFAESVPHFTSPAQRRYRRAGGDLFACEVAFDAHPRERFFGLGQHQHGLLDQKGAVIDLVQRNTEVSVPFVLSSRGYGFLWNMPGVGRVELGRNRTRWTADTARQIDYWVTAGPTPADIVSRYARVTGLPPVLPEWASGFWQSKLRYLDQSELLEVAREYKRRGLPLSVIVCDYFHWTRQGEWKFDPTEWPDPQAMVDELRELGVELLVSVWPTVNPNSENYAEMDSRGLLVRYMEGLPLQLPFWDKGTDGQVFMRFYDSTNPEARRYIWEKVTEGYRRYGIRAFWLDACEPEILSDNAENARYFLGQGSEVQGIYPARARSGRSTRDCTRAARTRECCSAGPPGPAASATGRPSGRATSSPPSRHSPNRYRPVSTSAWPGSPGGQPTSADSRMATPQPPTSGNSSCGGSSSASSARSSGSTESASPGPLSAPARPAPPMKSGHSARRRTRSSGSSSHCASGCART